MKTYTATAVLGAFVLGLFWPVPPSQADSSLGGYTASAQATAVRVMLFEPSLPLPAEPQGDVGVGFTRSNTATGPSSRALASYLWPGDALGDGLGVLTGNETFDYPVKVNSKYPAAGDAPASNTAQLTDGNGMTTLADGSVTRSTVTGLGISGLGTNLLSGIGTGLCGLLQPECPEPPNGQAPVAVPAPLSTAVTMESVFSQSTVTLEDDGITSRARTKASGLSLLAGVITIDSLDMSVVVHSNGDKADSSGTSTISGLKVAGQEIALGGKVDLGGSSTALPTLPLDVLKPLGLAIEYLPTTKEVDEASGSLTAQGLTITVDVAKLRDALNLGGIADPLAPILEQIPTLGPLLAGLARLGSKLVIALGDVQALAKATPAYVAPPVDDTEDTDDADDAEDEADRSGTDPAGLDDGSAPDASPPATTTPVEGAPTTDDVSTTPVAGTPLPPLGRVPSLLLLAALALASAIGWVFRTFGSSFLGSPNCLMGLKSGCPDLRKG